MKGYKGMIRKNPKGTVGAILICMACLLAMSFITTYITEKEEEIEVSYNEFMGYADADKVESIDIELSSETFRFRLKETTGEENNLGMEERISETVYVTQNPKYGDFKKDMLEKGIKVNEKPSRLSFGTILYAILSITITICIFTGLQKQIGGDDTVSGLLSKKKDYNITFDDIAGLKEVKQDLSTIVDFLKSPGKYKKSGAKLPRGIIFYGPPGTGKTLLAKAIAGEAGVDFIPAVASEFDEKFVGVGASRIRKLFSEAKKKAPCIIFIDEIDAIGNRRMSDGAVSYRQSLNQLLSEMDGFSSDSGVIVIAATNRLEDLDTALVRPGRFDSHYAVPLPANTSDRRAIIDIYAKNKNFDDTVDFELLAKETLGCSPADIESVINEATIIAVKENNGVITKDNLDDAFYKCIMKGHKKKDMERKQEEIRITAYHEAGHALLGTLFGQDVTAVTIVPSTSGAGGVTFFNQEKLGMYSKAELENNVMALYGGRCAEEMIVGKDNVTTGASNDIKQASKILKSIVCEYGMSSFGMVSLDEIGVDKNTIVNAVAEIADELYYSAFSVLSENSDKLDALADMLMEKETLTGDEVRNIVHGRMHPK